MAPVRTDLDDLVARAQDGSARAVAQLISLVEDSGAGGGSTARALAAALAPHAARRRRRAHRVPRGREVTTTSALVTALRADDRGTVSSPSTPAPFSGGALLGDRVRMSDRHRSGRLHPLDGHPGTSAGSTAAAPQALRVLDAAVSTSCWSDRRVGSPSRGRRAGGHHRRLLAPGMGEASRRPRRASRDRRRLLRQQGRPRGRGRDGARAPEHHGDDAARERPGWRTPVVRTGGRRRGHGRPARRDPRPPRLDGRARTPRRGRRRRPAPRSRRSRSPTWPRHCVRCPAVALDPWPARWRPRSRPVRRRGPAARGRCRQRFMQQRLAALLTTGDPVASALGEGSRRCGAGGWSGALAPAGCRARGAGPTMAQARVAPWSGRRGDAGLAGGQAAFGLTPSCVCFRVWARKHTHRREALTDPDRREGVDEPGDDDRDRGTTTSATAAR